MLLSIADINRDFQPPETIEPVMVYSDGKTIWLFDGFHRVAASIILGLTDIEAAIVPGNYADMELRWQEGLKAIHAELAAWAAEQARKVK